MHNPLKEISSNSSKRRLKKKACCIHLNTIFWGLFSGGGVNKLAYTIPSASAAGIIVVCVPALYYYRKRRTQGPRPGAGPSYGAVINNEENNIIKGNDNAGNGNRDNQVV